MQRLESQCKFCNVAFVEAPMRLGKLSGSPLCSYGYGWPGDWAECQDSCCSTQYIQNKVSTGLSGLFFDVASDSSGRQYCASWRTDPMTLFVARRRTSANASMYSSCRQLLQCAVSMSSSVMETINACILSRASSVPPTGVPLKADSKPMGICYAVLTRQRSSDTYLSDLEGSTKSNASQVFRVRSEESSKKNHVVSTWYLKKEHVSVSKDWRWCEEFFSDVQSWPGEGSDFGFRGLHECGVYIVREAAFNERFGANCCEQYPSEYFRCLGSLSP